MILCSFGLWRPWSLSSRLIQMSENICYISRRSLDFKPVCPYGHTNNIVLQFGTDVLISRYSKITSIMFVSDRRWGTCQRRTYMYRFYITWTLEILRIDSTPRATGTPASGHLGTGTKWPPHWTQHIQRHSLEIIFCILIEISLKLPPEGSIDNSVSIYIYILYIYK